jgi:DUF438 domain-containing protein
MSEIIDNRSRRIRQLKDIITRLHQGVSPEEVRGQLAEIVHHTDHSEIVAMEQQLIAEGLPIEQLQGLCDLHSQVTRGILLQFPPPAFAAGHPVDTMRRENAALTEAIARTRAALASGDTLAARQGFNDLADVDKHYQRKEHAFFSKLEKHGVFGPSKVMWAKDDEVRTLLKDARHNPEAALAAVDEMIQKEERILLPMCQDLFTEEDWAEIWAASPRYGWCLVEPGNAYRPAEAVLKQTLQVPATEAIPFPTGHLSLTQLTALFSTLPVDLTFVDADDRVAFFSEGPNRVFARSRAVVGRKVQNCHPPRSVEIVDRILDDFRSGRQSLAEFWIDFHGRFVHIRYFAVRDEAGAYLGTLEVTQDVAGIRSLTGERRLLEYAG